METLKEKKTETKRQTTVRISGAEAIIHCLLAEGVDLIYGYPGGAIMPVYDELYKFQDKLTHILTRHEQGAAHAAQGYARVTGKVGVAMATSGPGATNLVTGIADAQIDSTPMVCITGQVARHLLGSDAFQETDIIGISTPVTKWNYQITQASEIPEIMAKAIVRNRGRTHQFGQKAVYHFWTGRHPQQGRETIEGLDRESGYSCGMDHSRTFCFGYRSPLERGDGGNARQLWTQCPNQ